MSKHISINNLFLQIQDYIQFVLNSSMEEFFNGIDLGDKAVVLKLFKATANFENVENFELYNILGNKIISNSDKCKQDLYKMLPFLQKCILIFKNEGIKDLHTYLIINILSILEERIMVLLNIESIYVTGSIIRSIYELYLKFNHIYICSFYNISEVTDEYKDIVKFKTIMWQISSFKFRADLNHKNAIVDFQKEKDEEADKISSLIKEVKKGKIYNTIIDEWRKNLKFKDNGTGLFSQSKCDAFFFDKNNLNINEKGEVPDYSNLPKLAKLGSFFYDKYNLFSQFSHPTYEPIEQYEYYKNNDLTKICYFVSNMLISKFFNDINIIYGIPVFDYFLQYYLLAAEYISPEEKIEELNLEKLNLINKMIKSDRKYISNPGFIFKCKDKSFIEIQKNNFSELIMRYKEVKKEIKKIKNNL